MATKKKRKTRLQKKRKGWFSYNGKKLLVSFFLLSFLMFSIGVLTYVIFFRVVVT